MATSRSMDELGRRIGDLSKALASNIENVMAEVVTEIGREVVLATPVDTGYARGNWRPSINSPAESPISFLDGTGQATISRIAIVGRRYRTGDVVYIVNRAPYIGALIAGSSPQAPPNFHVNALIQGERTAFRRARERGFLIRRSLAR